MWAHHVCALLFACRQTSSFLQNVQFVDLAGNRAKSCKQSTSSTTSKSSPSCLMQSVLYLHTDLYRESTIHYTSPHKRILNSYPVKEVKKALSEQAGQHFISCFFVFDGVFFVTVSVPVNFLTNQHSTFRIHIHQAMHFPIILHFV